MTLQLDEGAEDYEEQAAALAKKEAKKEYQRNRMKFNRSIDSALPVHLFVCVCSLQCDIMDLNFGYTSPCSPGFQDQTCPDAILKKAAEGNYSALDAKQLHTTSPIREPERV